MSTASGPWLESISICFSAHMAIFSLSASFLILVKPPRTITRTHACILWIGICAVSSISSSLYFFASSTSRAAVMNLYTRQFSACLASTFAASKYSILVYTGLITLWIGQRFRQWCTLMDFGTIKSCTWSKWGYFSTATCSSVAFQ